MGNRWVMGGAGMGVGTASGAEREAWRYKRTTIGPGYPWNETARLLLIPESLMEFYVAAM